MIPNLFLLIDRSTLFPKEPGWLRALASALDAQLADIAEYTGTEATVEALDPGSDPAPLLAGGRVRQVLILDDSDQAMALGYHSADGTAKVFCRYQGQALSLSQISGAASHEVVEDEFNPATNRYCLDGQGRLWIMERCDPVNNELYYSGVNWPDDGTRPEAGGGILVSDFTTDQYWDPQGVPPYTHFQAMATGADPSIRAPFALGGNGYGYYWQGGTGHNVHGELLPDAAGEPPPMSRRQRTQARLHEANLAGSPPEG